MEGLKSIRQCMSNTEVQALLGRPDFSQSGFGPKGPNEQWLGFSWKCYLAKKDADITNSNDPSVQVFFDTSDRAIWIVPIQIAGEEELGAYNALCP
jgi:hypothetical protein